MSVGLGACYASRTVNGSVSGLDHREGILDLRFTGATGTVEFGSNRYGQRSSRTPSTVSFGALNILPNGEWNLTAIIAAGTNLTWKELSPFQYADGGTESPMPLKDPPTPIYISTGLRAYGLSLMSLGILGAIVSIVWVYVNRAHRIVASSQPPFMYIVMAGCILQSASIFLISFDEVS